MSDDFPSNPKNWQEFSLPEMAEATGSDDLHIVDARVEELAEALWMGGGRNADNVEARKMSALQALKDFDPHDELERQLATLMIATKSAAMDSYRAALNLSNNLMRRDADLRHAERLTGTFTKLAATFDKHRRNGEQHITVERVEVSDGGQAIVGNVRTGGSPKKKPKRKKPRPYREHEQNWDIPGPEDEPEAIEEGHEEPLAWDNPERSSAQHIDED